jgi:hypothetical protein
MIFVETIGENHVQLSETANQNIVQSPIYCLTHSVFGRLFHRDGYKRLDDDVKILFKNSKHRKEILYEVFESYLVWYEIKHLRAKLCGKVQCDCSSNKIGYTSTSPRIEIEIDQGGLGCVNGYKIRTKK